VNTFALILSAKPEHSTVVEKRVVDSCSAMTKKQATRMMLRRNKEHPVSNLTVAFYNQSSPPTNGVLVTETPSGAVRPL
jgi:hypothetical protein